MIQDGRKGTKPLYESPKVMKLSNNDDASGACSGLGSGDGDFCNQGNSASYCVINGSAASGNCFSSGSSAGGLCDGNGNSAAF
jgi:hypothetical protein